MNAWFFDAMIALFVLAGLFLWSMNTYLRVRREIDLLLEMLFQDDPEKIMEMKIAFTHTELHGIVKSYNNSIGSDEPIFSAAQIFSRQRVKLRNYFLQVWLVHKLTTMTRSSLGRIIHGKAIHYDNKLIADVALWWEVPDD